MKLISWMFYFIYYACVPHQGESFIRSIDPSQEGLSAAGWRGWGGNSGPRSSCLLLSFILHSPGGSHWKACSHTGVPVPLHGLGSRYTPCQSCPSSHVFLWTGMDLLTWIPDRFLINNCSLTTSAHSLPQTVCWTLRVGEPWPQIPGFSSDQNWSDLRLSCQWCRSHLEPRWLGSYIGSTGGFQQSVWGEEKGHYQETNELWLLLIFK